MARFGWVSMASVLRDAGVAVSRYGPAALPGARPHARLSGAPARGRVALPASGTTRETHSCRAIGARGFARRAGAWATRNKADAPLSYRKARRYLRRPAGRRYGLPVHRCNGAGIH